MKMPPPRFVDRHVGPREADLEAMLATIGAASLDALCDEAVPDSIQMSGSLDLPPAAEEHVAIAELRAIAGRNQVLRSYIGQGYYGCRIPAVIQRNILENPGWYTQYTPYQAEISQWRLEALLNFQTMVSELTGLPVANSSLLDEATAAAEAMTVALGVRGRKPGRTFVVSDGCHPQTIDVIRTRARPVGVEVRVVAGQDIVLTDDVFGVLVQVPDTRGRVFDPSEVCEKAHSVGALAICATDLLALNLMKSPGDCGFDVAIGNTQRFGVPLGFGGPHAAFMAVRDDLRRKLPGRIVGVSVDVHGNRALRLALQSREQHIRRGQATSNICTSQVLLAIMASMYAVYHGPEGLQRIAVDVRNRAARLRDALERGGLVVGEGPIFDTVLVTVDDAEVIHRRARAAGANLRAVDPGSIGISLDETTTDDDVIQLAGIVLGNETDVNAAQVDTEFGEMEREGAGLSHGVFDRYHSEHEMLRYMNRLQAKDLSLTTSMIPLGSCTMKLNATAEMIPVTWPEFSDIHPFAPADQVEGYTELISQLGSMLGEITGLPAVSLQPNAGSQGEYAGLLVIRAFHRSTGEKERHVCLIPDSAHGTNPASAVMAGMEVVVVRCDEHGSIDLEDLRSKAEAHADSLSAVMVTYPSTHGVFEDTIVELCRIVHEFGGQVYLDGANMNAQVGLCRPGDYGVDVCHLNLHKTFSIPHGGGGPGVGPIAVASHLAPFLPGHGVAAVGGEKAIGAIAAAPYGSAAVLPISWMYIRLLGADGARRASQVAILNANYLAGRIEDVYSILYRGDHGRVAHEFIVDLRGLRRSCGITVADVAKRLMDYGFHAPTMSWPVPETLMIEPTESESRQELDRFADAMKSIRREIDAVESGRLDVSESPLRHAPHTAASVLTQEWDRPYSREEGAFPADSCRDHKFWPPVGRVDDAFGDRNLVCACPPLAAYGS